MDNLMKFLKYYYLEDDSVEAPKDAILSITERYRQFLIDHPEKLAINVGVGVFFNDDLKLKLFNCVKEAETEIKKMLFDGETTKKYLPQDGLPEFKKEVKKLLFKEDEEEEKEKNNKMKWEDLEERIFTSQSLSGTGALRLAMEFLTKLYLKPEGTGIPELTKTTKFNDPKKPIKIFIPNVTWGNHKGLISSQMGLLQQETYRYYDSKTRSLDKTGLFEDLEKKVTPQSCVLFHTCCHNPSGVDIVEKKDWESIGKIMLKNDNIVLFDSAYLGFATGDFKKDSEPIRILTKLGVKVIVAQSFAKNLGLYSERIGALHIVCKNKQEKIIVQSHMKKIVRIMYSNPPVHGALIVSYILKNQKLKNMWKNELIQVQKRLKKMRKILRDKLNEKQPGKWEHIMSQRGMFSYTGLTPEQVDKLEKDGKDYGVFMLRNGRINIAGLNEKNVIVLAKAIIDVTSQ